MAEILNSDHGLRQRHEKASPADIRHDHGSEDDLEEDEVSPSASLNREKKTFGRTPDGTVFTVPQTHDMVSQLLSPSQPKNKSDILVLAVLALLVLTLYVLPSSLRRPVFAVTFLFWRGAYNVGIGYLLHVQSNHRRLVTWAKKTGIFEKPSTGKNHYPKLYNIIKVEMETKIPHDYKFEEAPIEYNTWLLFRRVVDLILMCDFVSYCLFAVACGSRPPGESTGMTIARWAIGVGLFGFNLWVKLDAHRVVKDYAWYWGDFFYLIDQKLTFDGVFEMAPHPMYSVGYAGYYGISLMAASYSVLFISIVAHAAQFAFLYIVENPHIEKTYNPPPPRKPLSLADQAALKSTYNYQGQSFLLNDASIPRLGTSLQPSPVHNIMGFNNIDFYRITDTSVVLLQIYMLILTTTTPSTPLFQTLFVVHAIIWRLWFSVGLGYILNRQSTKKKWTRHFVKYGESTEEAWRQWKGMYHLSLTMSYASFVAATWKMYSFPADWGYGLVLLKHVLGFALAALQIWTSFSIYDSLGEFGWFFGDFFFDQAPKLTYSGIYRYLNNPERVIGLAGIWGAVLISGSTAIFFLALLSHILTLAFLQLVERPHMQKLYGRNLRQEAGLVKSLRRSLPPPLKHWQGSVDKVLTETVDFVEEFIESARPRIAAGVRHFVKDTKTLFRHYPARISLTMLAPDLAGFDPKDYSVEIEDSASSGSETSKASNGKKNGFESPTFEYGEPIRIRWTAPLNHNERDWIGLYMVADNPSREATRIASAGRWVATNPGVYDSTTADQGILVSNARIAKPSADSLPEHEPREQYSGSMIFEGDKLWWRQGVFEFRYHHAGKHNVMAISRPFEIRVPRFDEDDVEPDPGNGMVRGAAERALLKVVRNCLDRDPEIAPTTVDEAYGSAVEREEKFAKRVVYAVQHMFGIEFAPEVVQADGNVRNLAWRICNAKKVLAPYSMSPSRGASTPTTPKY